MLTGNEIKNQQELGGLLVRPFDPGMVGPNSIDVHLAAELLIYTRPTLDARYDNPTELIKIPETGLVLLPGRLYLGSTVEYTESPDFIPMYEGRSSLGRLGLSSHITAGFGDIGYKGHWTLELSTVQPLRIYPGMKIGQLYFHRPDGEVLRLYDGKYQGASGVLASRLYKDYEEVPE